MLESPHDCRFCGRYVLEVEGWAESLKPGHRVLAPWSDDPTLFHGFYHWSCVRESEFGPKFRTELLNWICRKDHLVTVREDGLLQDIPRTGLGYTQHVATVLSGDIYAHPRFDRWVFAETAGPTHFLDFAQARTLSRGEPLRGNSGGRPAFLPTNPGDPVIEWDAAELLDFLQVRDLYQEMIDGFTPEYSFWRGSPKDAGYVLTYSLSAVRPVPEDVAEFFRTYLPRYTPKQPENVRTTPGPEGPAPQHSPPQEYDGWTRLPVVYLPVTLGDRLVGYLWGSEHGRAAGFFPHLAADIDRLRSSSFWYAKLSEAHHLGLTPADAIRHWIGQPEDSRYGGISNDAEEAASPTIQELALHLNPGVPLGDGPWVQDGTFPSGAPENRSEGFGPLVSVRTTTFRNDTASPVVYLPVTVRGTVVGYVWASTADDAGGYLVRAAVGRAGVVAGGLWRSRFIDAYQTGLTALEALRRCRTLPDRAPGTFGVIDENTPEQSAASLFDLNALAELD